MSAHVTHLSSLVIAALVAAPAGASIPEVSNVTMSQAGDRLVTITYRLADAPAVVTLDIQTNANTSASANDPGWTSIGGQYISNAQGDVWKQVSGKETYTITWHPDKSWIDAEDEGFKIKANGARARVTAWPLDNTPDYMVVDISAAAQANTQKYYPGADFVPAGVSQQQPSDDPLQPLRLPPALHRGVAVGFQKGRCWSPHSRRGVFV